MEELSFNIRRLAVCLVLLLAVSCCTGFSGEEGSGASVHRTAVSFDVRIVDGETVWPSGGAVIRDVNIYVYRDGRLECSAYTEDISKTGISVESGKEYRFYALANVGLRYPPVDEHILKSSIYDIAGMDDIQTAEMPMSASASGHIAGAHCSVALALSPVVAKLGLRVAVPSSVDFRVKSIIIGNLASDWCPFVEPYQARSMLDGTWPVPEDGIRAVNDGRIVYASIPENCQGMQFPDNRDSRDKVPDNLPPEKRDRCTYIEMTALRDMNTPVTYRLCLGRDAVSDCNVVRNTYTRITLRLTGDGEYDFIWEVENGLPGTGISFIAAGDSSSVLYTDSQGELVDIRTGTGTWRDIAHDARGYVMVSDGGSLAFSADGESWQVTETGGICWQAVTSGEGKYVAVGYSYGSSYPRRVTGYTAVSGDGASWKLYRQNSCLLEDVAYGDGIFMATGYVTVTGALTSGRFFMLDDGYVWQTLTGLYRMAYPCLVYGKDGFAALDDGYVVYSGDGMEWTPEEDTGCRDICHMAYGGGTYVGTGPYGMAVYSLGGFGWTAAETAGSGSSSVSYGNGIFISPGKDGLVMFSADGESWKKVATGCHHDLYCATVKY